MYRTVTHGGVRGRLIKSMVSLLLDYILVSKKPFAYAIFRILRVKVLFYVDNLRSSAAPFLCLSQPEISVMPKK